MVDVNNLEKARQMAPILCVHKDSFKEQELHCHLSSCKEWSHLMCIDLYMPEKVVTPKGKWFCCK